MTRLFVVEAGYQIMESFYEEMHFTFLIYNLITRLEMQHQLYQWGANLDDIKWERHCEITKGCYLI